jgi:hypothetical protein
MGAHGSPVCFCGISHQENLESDFTQSHTVHTLQWSYSPFYVLLLKCSVYGGSPMRFPKALCSVPLNKSVFITSTSVVHSV